MTDLYPVNTGETTTPVTLHNFVIEWTKQGHNVDVIKPNFLLNSIIRGKSFYKTGFYDHDDIKIFNVNYFTPFCFNILKKIPKEFDLAGYDALIAHMPSGMIFANKLAKIFKKPFVCGVHFSDIEVLTNPIYKLFFRSQLKKAYKNAKKIACRSFVLQKKFNELMPEYADKTFIASSGVNINPTTIRPFDPSNIKVLTCANLIKRKNIDKLILAINELEGFELKIIGDGKELKHLKKMASKNIKFLDRLENKQVLQEMQKSDIFILPSVNETFGMVYLEAMASGCVTVCTKNSGIDGIIKNAENGFLTDPTVEGIKKTLLKIKNFDNVEQLVKNSLNTVKEYTREACAKNYLENINL